MLSLTTLYLSLEVLSITFNLDLVRMFRYIIGNNGLLIPAAAFSYVGATTAKIVD